MLVSLTIEQLFKVRPSFNTRSFYLTSTTNLVRWKTKYGLERISETHNYQPSAVMELPKSVSNNRILYDGVPLLDFQK